ncbi:MAG: adenylyl-sulfate kinase [Gammaproteobacteria bacterium]|nr:adenylyl-sulfate kinase [Gammaproteobacteria bacterium]
MAGENKATMLRFITCGSVDDGKSTLIGRLLHDAGKILIDQIAALETASARHGTTGEEIDLALLLDGLEAERAQGITIDVAYRHFSTPKRDFLIADTPGHVQYTRNMATAASTADAAVLLVDARKGVLTQTRRHASICSLLGVRHVIVAINKMDCIDYDEAKYAETSRQLDAVLAPLSFLSRTLIPVSALKGDNVFVRSARMPWFTGAPLIEQLETLDATRDTMSALRLPVQLAIRPDADFRGLAGTISSGRLSVGDSVLVQPSERRTTIASVRTSEGQADSAAAGDAAVVTLSDEIDVSRGDVLSAPGQPMQVSDHFTAHLVWMIDEALLAGRQYQMRIGNRWLPATVTSIKHRCDIETGANAASSRLELNEIGLVNIATGSPVPFDPYRENRSTGAFILVDRLSNATAAAGIIEHGLRRATNVRRQATTIDAAARARQKYQTAKCIWFTGLSGSGKSTLANALEARLEENGRHTMLLDGDNLRLGLNKNLGFTEADRVENIRRAGEVARLMVDAGLIVICSFISPYQADRDMVRQLFSDGQFFEVFVDTPLDECMRRDPKGLYKKALAGEIPNFTGVTSPYERPTKPEVHLGGEAGGLHEEQDTSIDRALGMILKVIGE